MVSTGSQGDEAAVSGERRGGGLLRWLADATRLEKAVWLSLRLFVFAVPFSIALSQILLTLTTALALRHRWVAGLPWPRLPIDRPLAAFLLAALSAAAFGLDFYQALWGTRTYLQVVLVYIIVAEVGTAERARALLQCFLAGMVLTSLHTVANGVLPWALPDPFPGSMTESGQLLFALGFSAALWLAGGLWPAWIGKTTLLHGLALAINLKRGVWLGAITTLTILGGLRSRRLLVATALSVILAIIAIPAVRARLMNTQRDLFLPGQRYDIWTAAIDVIERFPMGIGRKNGTILRDYPNINARHKHAHNNLLQITMEFGFLGLLAFVWWMVEWARVLRRIAHASPRGDPVIEAIALASVSTFVGFHVAGLVEYNFGDTEVLLVVFLTMGLTLALDRIGEPREPAPG